LLFQPAAVSWAISVVGGVLGFRVDGDRAALGGRLGLHEVDEFLEGHDLEDAVVDRRALCIGGDGAQGLDLGQREVAGEPAGLRLAVDLRGLLAGGELGVAGDVGAVVEVGVVAGDEHAVLGGDQVRLDHVGAEVDRQRVGLQRLLGQVAGRATVRHDHRRRAVQRLQRQRAGRGGAVIAATAGGQQRGAGQCHGAPARHRSVGQGGHGARSRWVCKGL